MYFLFLNKISVLFTASVMMDSSPIIFLREKRTVARSYPHRTMMFTGYYRPIRRSGNDGHATGLFAQGNAVSGQTFFGGMHAPHLKDGPEPIEESEVSSAHAQAASDEEHHHHYHHQNEVHRHEEEQYHEHHEKEKHHHHHQDSSQVFVKFIDIQSKEPQKREREREISL